MLGKWKCLISPAQKLSRWILGKPAVSLFMNIIIPLMAKGALSASPSSDAIEMINIAW